ncbi:MAG: HlyDD23 domain-containing protein [Nitrospira sp.]|nr:HlyD family efflux transporter periplasmic adaptor subunit [Nitrospira sp.]ULA60005.1 MAG: HlyDD23 domain-containing protein [Nitrospira sp.]
MQATASSEPTSREIATLIHLATLTHLEGQVRAATTLQELQFVAVNETRRLVPYEHAVLLSPPDLDGAAYRAVTASSVAAIDRNAPMMVWLEEAVQAVRHAQPGDLPIIVESEALPESVRAGWHEFVRGHVLWCPLKHPDDTILGGLWIERESPWQDNDVTIVRRLAGSFAYAWKALATRHVGWVTRLTRPSLVLIAVAVLGLLCLPIRLSTVAPVKVVAQDPVIVSAPMDGVIAEVVVAPNTLVQQHRVLLRYDDTNIRNQFRVTEQQLAVARAEQVHAIQSGFGDPQRKAEVPLKAAEVALKETELEYAQERLGQIDVLAPQAGVVLFTDKSDWVGKPVSVGERIMEIADPRRIELRIDLPVSDALMLQEGGEVIAFFDALPLESFPGAVSRSSYHAEVLPGDILAYRVMANLSHADPRIRIGWQGSAKVYGEQGPLAFLLFRRPFTALRQLVGL